MRRSVNNFPDLTSVLKRAPLIDVLLNVDPETIESISRDKHRLSLAEDVDSLLQAILKTLNLHAVSAILANHPEFDLTDPKIHGAVSFIPQQIRERSIAEDPLLQNITST